MDTAKRFSQLSTAKRLQVGAIIVKNDRIISIGYNGTVSGWDNNCEDIIAMKNLPDGTKEPILKTKPEVIHAEQNCLYKLAKSNESGENSTMFITHAPCIECAKGIYTSGIKKVYFNQHYRDTVGIDFLIECGVELEKLD